MTENAADNSHVANTVEIKDFGVVRFLLAPDMADKSNRCSLLEPFPFQEKVGDSIREKGEPRFSCTAILTKEQKKLLEPYAIAAARKKFGEDVNLKDIRFPFRSGDKIAEKRREKNKDGDLYEDMIVINPKAYADRFDPGTNVAVLKDGIIAKATAEDLYSGMYGHMKIAFAGYKGQREDDKDGVTIYLRSIIKTKEGERIGGSSAASDFSMVAGRESDEDPTGDYDEEDITVD